MGKFKNGDVTVDAWQFSDEPDANPPAPGWYVDGLLDGRIRLRRRTLMRYAEVVTQSQLVLAATGDWIIKGVNGEFYCCRPDIFAATYGPVTE